MKYTFCKIFEQKIILSSILHLQLNNFAVNQFNNMTITSIEKTTEELEGR